MVDDPARRGEFPAHATISNMIEITVNGDRRTLPASTSVADLVESLGLAGKRIAVERNGEIVPRSRHAGVPLADGDRLEIVVAVGGG
jgi:sulfur carrier protein